MKYSEINNILQQANNEAAKAGKMNCKEVEMLYSEYKNNYSDLETVRDSYNRDTKTIKVLVPEPMTDEELEAEIAKTIPVERKFIRAAIQNTADAEARIAQARAIGKGDHPFVENLAAVVAIIKKVRRG